MKGILVMAVVLALTLTGCSTIVLSSLQQQGAAPGSAMSGTQGLAINFLGNQPPTRVIVQNLDTIPATIEVRNLGATTVSDAVLAYGGFDQSVVGWAKSDTSLGTLEGKTQYNSQGGMVQRAVAGVGGKGVGGTVHTDLFNDMYTPTFQASVCYTYETHAQVPVCLDLDPFGNSPKACSPSDFSSSTGQGAPVAVTAVSQDSAEGKTLFKITVSNVGGGEVFHGTPGMCLPTTKNPITYNELDHLTVTGVSVGSTKLDLTKDCKGTEVATDGSGNQLLTLINGQAVLFCTYTGQVGPAYTTTLNVGLRYEYSTTISRQVQIVKIS